ncbi:hypothetical protein RQP46_004606 [Phenoliferia psychrophenolica]
MASVEGAPAKAERPQTRHEWYQTDSAVVLSIFIRNVDPSSLKVDFEDRSFTISFPLPTGSEFSWGIDPLSHAIDPTKSSFRVLAPKIELSLAKRDASLRWGKLEGDDTATLDTMAPTSTTTPSSHSYPSSSKKHTNWDAFAKAAAAEEEATATAQATSKDPNAGGDKQLNELFQKLYAGATEDQRKAMIKSYQESNGTALSTDWGEVSKGKVETKPPDSMIAKKWGK